MRVVVAIDSFKGSLSSLQAGSAVKDAILKVYKDAEVLVSPLADGGEGTVEAFSSSYNAQRIDVQVKGPLLKSVSAPYCVLGDGKTAVIEMAAASGITLVSDKERNPLETTTYGVGELIKDAINRGCRRFIIGIGGSATNDGGTGMLSALGFEFLDKDNKPIAMGAKGLKDLYRIETNNTLPQLKDCEFNIACDVKNPLCGPNGCSAVYGPQKGATEEMIEKMDAWLKEYAKKAKDVCEKADADYPGVGAAGGLGFAFLTFLNANLQRGIDIILSETRLEEKIKDADVVVTGEGRLDSQTVMGKAPIGVAQLAKKYAKPVIAFSGCVTEDAEVCNEHGIDAFFPIIRGITTLEEALNTENAYQNLYHTAHQAFRLLRLNNI